MMETNHRQKKKDNLQRTLITKKVHDDKIKFAFGVPYVTTIVNSYLNNRLPDKQRNNSFFYSERSPIGLFPC